MKNLWNKKIANDYIKKYAKKKISKDLALRIYTTHLLGSEKKISFAWWWQHFFKRNTKRYLQ